MTASEPAPVVLVADNDAGVCALLCEVLERSGIRTEGVADGSAALERLAAGGIDLLITDLDMPEVGGREVLRRLDEAGESADHGPPVMVVSGYVDARVEADLARCQRVRGVFRKPFDIFEFAASVRRALAPRGRGGDRGGPTSGPAETDA